jgi:hypothetical protein
VFSDGFFYERVRALYHERVRALYHERVRALYHERVRALYHERVRAIRAISAFFHQRVYRLPFIQPFSPISFVRKAQASELDHNSLCVHPASEDRLRQRLQQSDTGFVSLFLFSMRYVLVVLKYCFLDAFGRVFLFVEEGARTEASLSCGDQKATFICERSVFVGRDGIGFGGNLSILEFEITACVWFAVFFGARCVPQPRCVTKPRLVACESTVSFESV